MTRRYEGFAYPSFLAVLDTFTGEVRQVPLSGMAGEAPIPLDAATPLPSGPPSAAQSPESATPTDALPASLDAFDREVALTFPYPVARAWSALLQESDPRMQCKLLVDTFTAVLKMLARVPGTGNAAIWRGRGLAMIYALLCIIALLWSQSGDMSTEHSFQLADSV